MGHNVHDIHKPSAANQLPHTTQVICIYLFSSFSPLSLTLTPSLTSSISHYLAVALFLFSLSLSPFLFLFCKDGGRFFVI